MSDEYLSKEEIKKWRSSVEKITLEEYAARLGKKLQEEKKTNDLADMLYTHFNPRQSFDNYNTVTKLEKIDLSPKPHGAKQKASSKNIFDDIDNDDLDLNTSLDIEEQTLLKKIKSEKEQAKKTSAKTETPKESKNKETENKKKLKEETIEKQTVKTSKKENTFEKQETVKTNKKTTPTKKDAKTQIKKNKEKTHQTFDISSLNITFIKPLTDREEKVLAYFMEKRGEIVYAKDLADLLNLKRDYIYKYIKNLRSKMSTDIIVNADNGGFKLD